MASSVALSQHCAESPSACFPLLASLRQLSAAFLGLYTSMGSRKQTLRSDLAGVLSRDYFSAGFVGVANLGRLTSSQIASMLMCVFAAEI